MVRPSQPVRPTDKSKQPGRLRVYLGGRLGRREELLRYADELAAGDIEVVSRWLYSEVALPARATPQDEKPAETAAAMDLEDVASADVCISFSEEPEQAQGRGGRHVEFGVALALGRRLMLVGPREHVFHRLPQVEHFDEWSDAKAALGLGTARSALAAA